MNKAKDIPACLADATPLVFVVCLELAGAIEGSIRQAISESVPKATGRELNDMVEGVCLLAAQKAKGTRT